MSSVCSPRKSLKLTRFRNAVELIVSIIALTQKKVDIVQESLIGSMLSNLLLVMGMCFFFGGLKRVEQNFNVTVAQTASSLLALAIASLIIPAAFEAWAANGGAGKSIRFARMTPAEFFRRNRRSQRDQVITRSRSTALAGLHRLPYLSTQNSRRDVQCSERERRKEKA